MKQEQEDKIVEYLARMLGIIVIGLIVAVILAMCSCTRTVYVPQTTIQRDSIYITQYKRDSIYMHDSILVLRVRDSTIVEKWHTKYIERLSTDTLYVEKNDTIREPYVVEKPLSSLQKMWMNLGKFSAGICFCAIFLALGYIVSIKKR